MTQEQYAEIIKCIKFGVPAIADDLVNSFNSIVELANQRITELKKAQEGQNVKDTNKTKGDK